MASTIRENEFTFVSADKDDIALIEHIHEKILLRMFPDVNDIDSPEAIRSYLQSYSSLRGDTCKYVVLAIIGDDGVCLGVSIFGLFSCKECTFLKGEYTAIVPEVRGNGAFEKLMYQRNTFVQNLCSAEGVEPPGFAINELVSPSADREDHEGCRRILRMWRIHGYREIDMPFVQLPLRPELEPIYHFRLFFQPWSAKYRARSFLTGREALRIIDATCTFRDASIPPRRFEEYHIMVRHALSQEKISLCQ
ncbi:MAG: hypothetical protein GF344_06660 [Chitinivibrionales bacterium]|nr:hypothetical protein [Chitinivibrionales bacterium]MBD3356608.1 hypothetical protein [Chitinivibrionales bacterium]